MAIREVFEDGSVTSLFVVVGSSQARADRRAR
jgi:hypothetical protein